MSYETETNADNVDFLLTDERSLEQRIGAVSPGLAGIPAPRSKSPPGFLTHAAKSFLPWSPRPTG